MSAPQDMPQDEIKVILSRLTMTLEHIDQRLRNVENASDEGRKHDWQLYLTIVGMVGAALLWVSDSFGNALERESEVAKNSLNEKLVPITQSISFAGSERQILANKITESSSLFAGSIERLNGEMNRVQDRLDQITIDMAVISHQLGSRANQKPETSN